MCAATITLTTTYIPDVVTTATFTPLFTSTTSAPNNILYFDASASQGAARSLHIRKVGNRLGQDWHDSNSDKAHSADFISTIQEGPAKCTYLFSGQQEGASK
jgi:hypothetical protein